MRQWKETWSTMTLIPNILNRIFLNRTYRCSVWPWVPFLMSSRSPHQVKNKLPYLHYFPFPPANNDSRTRKREVTSVQFPELSNMERLDPSESSLCLQSSQWYVSLTHYFKWVKTEVEEENRNLTLTCLILMYNSCWMKTVNVVG